MCEIHDMPRVRFRYSWHRRTQINLQLVTPPIVFVQMRATDHRHAVRWQVRRFRRMLQCTEKTRRIRARKKMFRRDTFGSVIRGQLHGKGTVRRVNSSIPATLSNHFRDVDRLHDFNLSLSRAVYHQAKRGTPPG